ncbi:MAG: RNA polymerase-binding protein DksA, partial [Mariprofundaceae bacterium]|nr:RNA polymerase-binding protein DksA [Mariprofundaceae bacterium]
MALTKKQLSDFEKQLIDWRTELATGQTKNMHAMHEQEQNAFPDPTDQSSMETDRNVDRRIKDRERKLMKKVEQSVNGIREGG